MSEHSHGAKPLSGSDRPSRVAKPGRVCKEPECEVVLSVYNGGKYCSKHEPMIVPRTRGKKDPV
jgi:hypothetical protein